MFTPKKNIKPNRKTMNNAGKQKCRFGSIRKTSPQPDQKEKKRSQEGHKYPDQASSPKKHIFTKGATDSVQRIHGGRRNAAARFHRMQKFGRTTDRHPLINIIPANMQ